jgi:hypothetical protein
MEIISAAPVSQVQVFQVALLATGRAAATVDQLHIVLVEWLKEGVADILAERQQATQILAATSSKDKAASTAKLGLVLTCEDQSGIRTWKGWPHVCGLLGLPCDDSSLALAAVRAEQHASGPQGLSSVRNCLEICRREEGGLQPVRVEVKPSVTSGPGSAHATSTPNEVLWTFGAQRRVNHAPITGSVVASAFEPSAAVMQLPDAELEKCRETLMVRKRWMSHICATEEKRVKQALYMRGNGGSRLKDLRRNATSKQ